MKKKISLFIMLALMTLFLTGLTAQAAKYDTVRVLLVNGRSEDAFNPKKVLKKVEKAFLASKLGKNCTISHYNFDAKGTQGTVSEMDRAIKSAFGGAAKKDLLVFYYSGHGTDDGKSLALGEGKDAKYYYDYGKLAKKLTSYKAPCISVIEACESCGFIDYGYNKLKSKQKSKLTAFTSTQGYYSSYAWVFTSKLLDGIDGQKYNYKDIPADPAGSSLIDTATLAEYIDKGIVAECKYAGANRPLFQFFELNKDTAEIKIDKTVTLKAVQKKIKSSKIKWSSSDTSVATVSKSGVVTGKKAGKCTITAEINGATDICKITVKGVDKVTQVTCDNNFGPTLQSGVLSGKTKKGKTVWTYKTSEQSATELSSYAYYVRGSYVYLIDYNKYIRLDKQTGKVKMTKTLPEPIWGATLNVDSSSALYAIGYYDTKLYKIDFAGSVVWTHEFENVQWPYKIVLSATKVKVYFDNIDDLRILSVNRATGMA